MHSLNDHVTILYGSDWVTENPLEVYEDECLLFSEPHMSGEYVVSVHILDSEEYSLDPFKF